MFGAHFPAVEFQRASKVLVPPAMLSYAARLSQMLEVVRALLGNLPIALTSYYRPESTTQHREGTAIDFRLPAGVDAYTAAVILGSLGSRGVTWGQLIHYPYEERPHVHLSLPTGTARSAVLVQDSGGRYVAMAGGVLAAFPQAPGSGAVAGGQLPGTAVAGPGDEGGDEGVRLLAVAGGAFLVTLAVMA